MQVSLPPPYLEVSTKDATQSPVTARRGNFPPPRPSKFPTAACPTAVPTIPLTSLDILCSKWLDVCSCVAWTANGPCEAPISSGWYCSRHNAYNDAALRSTRVKEDQSADAPNTTSHDEAAPPPLSPVSPPVLLTASGDAEVAGLRLPSNHPAVPQLCCFPGCGQPPIDARGGAVDKTAPDTAAGVPAGPAAAPPGAGRYCWRCVGWRNQFFPLRAPISAAACDPRTKLPIAYVVALSPVRATPAFGQGPAGNTMNGGLSVSSHPAAASAGCTASVAAPTAGGTHADHAGGLGGPGATVVCGGIASAAIEKSSPSIVRCSLLEVRHEEVVHPAFASKPDAVWASLDGRWQQVGRVKFQRNVSREWVKPPTGLTAPHPVTTDLGSQSSKNADEEELVERITTTVTPQIVFSRPVPHGQIARGQAYFNAAVAYAAAAAGGLLSDSMSDADADAHKAEDGGTATVPATAAVGGHGAAHVRDVGDASADRSIDGARHPGGHSATPRTRTGSPCPLRNAASVSVSRTPATAALRAAVGGSAGEPDGMHSESVHTGRAGSCCVSECSKEAGQAVAVGRTGGPVDEACDPGAESEVRVVACPVPCAAAAAATDACCAYGAPGPLPRMSASPTVRTNLLIAHAPGWGGWPSDDGDAVGAAAAPDPPRAATGCSTTCALTDRHHVNAYGEVNVPVSGGTVSAAASATAPRRSTPVAAAAPDTPSSAAERKTDAAAMPAGPPTLVGIGVISPTPSPTVATVVPAGSPPQLHPHSTPGALPVDTALLRVTPLLRAHSTPPGPNVAHPFQSPVPSGGADPTSASCVRSAPCVYALMAHPHSVPLSSGTGGSGTVRVTSVGARDEASSPGLPSVTDRFGPNTSRSSREWHTGSPAANALPGGGDSVALPQVERGAAGAGADVCTDTLRALGGPDGEAVSDGARPAPETAPGGAVSDTAVSATSDAGMVKGIVLSKALEGAYPARADAGCVAGSSVPSTVHLSRRIASGSASCSGSGRASVGHRCGSACGAGSTRDSVDETLVHDEVPLVAAPCGAAAEVGDRRVDGVAVAVSREATPPPSQRAPQLPPLGSHGPHKHITEVGGGLERDRAAPTTDTPPLSPLPGDGTDAFGHESEPRGAGTGVSSSCPPTPWAPALLPDGTVPALADDWNRHITPMRLPPAARNPAFAPETIGLGGGFVAGAGHLLTGGAGGQHGSVLDVTTPVEGAMSGSRAPLDATAAERVPATPSGGTDVATAECPQTVAPGVTRPARAPWLGASAPLPPADGVAALSPPVSPSPVTIVQVRCPKATDVGGAVRREERTACGASPRNGTCTSGDHSPTGRRVMTLPPSFHPMVVAFPPLDTAADQASPTAGRLRADSMCKHEAECDSCRRGPR